MANCAKWTRLYRPCLWSTFTDVAKTPKIIFSSLHSISAHAPAFCRDTECCQCLQLAPFSPCETLLLNCLKQAVKITWCDLLLSYQSTKLKGNYNCASLFNRFLHLDIYGKESDSECSEAVESYWPHEGPRWLPGGCHLKREARGKKEGRRRFLLIQKQAFSLHALNW